MASAHKRPNKRSKKRAAPVQLSAQPTQHVVVDRANVTVTGLAYEKFKGWVPLFTGLAALGAVLTLLYNYWPSWARVTTEPTLVESIQKVQTEFTKKIGETKEVVIQHSDKNTMVVKEDVGKVSEQVKNVINEQRKARVQALELQERQLFLQRANINNSLSSVELQLSERPNDQFLKQRKTELEAIKQNIDRESESVKDQIRREKLQ